MRYSIRVSEVKGTSSYPGVVGQKLIDPKTLGEGVYPGSLELVTLNPGVSVPLDAHEDQEVFYVLEGGGLARVGEQEIPLEAGVALCAPSGVLHQMVNNGKTPLKYILAHAPFKFSKS